MIHIGRLIEHARMVAKLEGRTHKIGKVGRPQPPLAIELAYQRQIDQKVEPLYEIADRIIKPQIKAWSRGSGNRVDDYMEDVDRAFELAKATYNGVAPGDDLTALTRWYAKEISVRNRTELRGILQRAVGVDVFFEDKNLLAHMNAFTKQNVKLIKSVGEDYLDDLHTRIVSGIRQGDRVETLQDMIKDRFDVSAGRAKMIARDQVGKFNGELSRHRQTSLGIEEYKWRGMMDERERPMHIKLEGRTFRWDKPPITNSNGDRNNPGGDYLCRCTAEPVIPY